MRTQAEKAKAFAALHVPGEPFIIPNPWDVGTAKLCAHAGFKALATTSAGFANTLGRLDYEVTRDEALAHCQVMANATDLPVSADLEYGYSESLSGLRETYLRAAETGLVGASIEDTTPHADAPIRSIDEASERVAAVAEAVRELDFPFTLTARAENFLHGRPDLDDTIRRLIAYAEAGADVLYAPGLGKIEDIRAVVDAVSKPVNILAGFARIPLSRDELAAAGVARISIGSHLARVSLGAVSRALEEMAGSGTFGYIAAGEPYPDLRKAFGKV